MLSCCSRSVLPWSRTVTRFEAAEEAIDRAGKIHFGLLLLAAAAAIAALLGLVRLPPLQATVEDEFDQLEELGRTADSVATDLRAYLLADYGDDSTEAIALKSLLRDVRTARVTLDILLSRIAKTRSLDTTERVGLNLPLNNLVALSRFNVSIEMGYHIENEPVLRLAEIDLGTLKWPRSIDSARLEDLARFTYLASLRLLQLRELHGLVESPDAPLSPDDVAKIQAAIERTRNLAESDRAKGTRKGAAQLWDRWLTSEASSQSLKAALAVITFEQINALYNESLRRLDELTAWERGEVPLSIPGIQSDVDLRLALLCYPAVFAVGYLIIGIYLRLAANHAMMRGFPPTDGLLGVGPVFLLRTDAWDVWSVFASFVGWSVFLAPLLPLAVLLAIRSEILLTSVTQAYGSVFWASLVLLALAVVISSIALGQLRRIVRS